MHKNIEILIGRLATDPGLLERFAKKPQEVLREVGLELTAIEMAALAGTDPAAFREFTSALDPRLYKATLRSTVTENENNHK